MDKLNNTVRRKGRTFHNKWHSRGKETDELAYGIFQINFNARQKGKDSVETQNATVLGSLDSMHAKNRSVLEKLRIEAWNIEDKNEPKEEKSSIR